MKSKMSSKMKTALTIAGTDCSGGAGVQADIKTMTALGVYSMSAITALTAQNTVGVEDIMEVTPAFLEKQLDCIFRDIVPDAVKTGMVASKKLIDVIAEKLKEYQVTHLVVDPVMVSSSGARLISEDAINSLKEKLFPLATIITPNIPEIEIISGICVKDCDDMEKAAEHIQKEYGCSVLCKGGHNEKNADDLLVCQEKKWWLKGKRVSTENTHGTGCTLSSAIASNLAKGDTLFEAVQKAKEYVTGALKDGLDLGKGNGPLNHMYLL